MNPVLWFVRARLHRRLFVWFGATIVLTGVALGIVFGMVQRVRPGWERELAYVRVFVGGRFERVWDVPAERDELARSASRDLEAMVALETATREPIVAFGKPCTAKSFTLPITRGKQTIGFVTLCAERHRPQPWRIALPIVVAGLVLWGASGALARRLARPIGELARVAGELGAGNLSARVRLGRHHHGEAAALASTINRMAERIERTVAEQRELLAAVSHELRTPLARIRLLTEMARDGGADGRMLDQLDREVVEIDALVGDLLASSRVDFAMVAPRRLVAAEVAVKALERGGVDASVLVVDGETEGDGDSDSGSASPIAVDADPTLLARALSNLIDNAKRHGGGVQVFRVKRVDEGVCFEVEDAGAGFEGGEEARVFEPFYRRSEQGSLGLGLALVKRIAEAHGGSAYAENRKGGGARVGLRLRASAKGAAPAT